MGLSLGVGCIVFSAVSVNFTHRTSSLIGTFPDLSLSQDISAQFNASRDTAAIGLDAMVLGSNTWLLDCAESALTLPSDLLPIYEHFTLFYQHLHNGRKLTWLWQYSRCELRTRFAETPYTLLTSTYQAAILCQYNAADVYTLDELARATSIPKSYLKAILSTLVKPKILLEDGETYRLNVGT